MLLSLFSFVRANDNTSALEWSPAQFEELQLQVKKKTRISSSGKLLQINRNPIITPLSIFIIKKTILNFLVSP